jgi:hypothetical protein
MNMTRIATKAAAAAVVAAAALASPANAGTPCSESACQARVKVAEVVHWTSPERMSGQLEQLSVRARGRELRYEPAGDCVAYFYGGGAAARVSVCGRGKVRIRMRAAQLDRRPVTLSVRYRVAAPSA